MPKNENLIQLAPQGQKIALGGFIAGITIAVILIVMSIVMFATAAIDRNFTPAGITLGVGLALLAVSIPGTAVTAMRMEKNTRNRKEKLTEVWESDPPPAVVKRLKNNYDYDLDAFIAADKEYTEKEMDFIDRNRVVTTPTQRANKKRALVENINLSGIESIAKMKKQEEEGEAGESTVEEIHRKMAEEQASKRQ
jgi:hypothetical protein